MDSFCKEFTSRLTIDVFCSVQTLHLKLVRLKELHTTPAQQLVKDDEPCLLHDIAWFELGEWRSISNIINPMAWSVYCTCRNKTCSCFWYRCVCVVGLALPLQAMLSCERSAVQLLRCANIDGRPYSKRKETVLTASKALDLGGACERTSFSR